MASKAHLFIRPATTSRRTLAIPGTAGLDAALMLGAALLLRCWWFGNPVVQIDEQFYLLVGDRMLHGAVPFIDIWDRKPIGLFLVYAAIRLLGGDGILQYQLVATACAAATAWLIVRMARHFADAAAARTAGVIALLWMIAFDGAGGQAPVIYGPLVAGAALITLRMVEADSLPPRALLGRGMAAMALIGLAMQIKYTALFEGMTLGLLLLWTGWRSGIALPRLAGCGALWIAVAIAPTGIAFGTYAHWGHAAAFIYANFFSIGDRPPTEGAVILKRFAVVALYSAPLIIGAGVGLRDRAATAGDERARWFMLCWLAGALIGFVAIGTFYKHYFLPAIVPLAVAAAPCIAALRRRAALLPAILIVPGIVVAGVTSAERLHARGDGRQVATLLGALPSNSRHHVYVFAGDPILYLLTGSRLPTRFSFPGHLSEVREAPAIGIDAVAEVRRILATRPDVVFSTDYPDHGANPATWGVMRAALGRGYRPVASVHVGEHVRTAYLRNDLRQR